MSTIDRSPPAAVGRRGTDGVGATRGSVSGVGEGLWGFGRNLLVEVSIGSGEGEFQIHAARDVGTESK